MKNFGDLFNQFKSLIGDELLITNNVLKNKKKKTELTEVPLDDMIKKLILIDFGIMHRFNDSLMMTLELLESIALNQIKLKKDMINLLQLSIQHVNKIKIR
jgi:hypothetical protein